MKNTLFVILLEVKSCNKKEISLVTTKLVSANRNLYVWMHYEHMIHTMGY